MTQKKPLPELQPEIWDRIISFLRGNPVSPPAGSTDGASFSDGETKVPKPLHEQDLAHMMSVSSTFNSLVAPHLYTDIITNDFGALIWGIETPEEGSRKSVSKRDLLSRTTTLRLEYTDEAEPPTYYHLLLFGFWQLVAASADSPDDTKTAKLYQSIWSSIEVARIMRGLRSLLRAGGAGTIFTSLDILSLGSVLGDQSTIWKEEDFTAQVSTASRHLTEFAQSVPITSLCARNALGPLSIHSGTWPSDTKLVDLTIHFGMDSETWPEIYGIPYRLVFDEPNGKSVYWPELHSLCLDHIDHFNNHMQARRDRLNVTLYASSNSIEYAEDELGPEWPGEGPVIEHLDEKTEAEVVKEAESNVRRHYISRMIDHKLSWKPITEANPCRACGWKAPKGSLVC